VANACTLDSGGKIIAHLTGISGVQFAAKEGCNMICFNGMHCGTDDGVVKWLEFGLSMEDDVGGEFHLHQAPVVTGAEALMYRAELPCPSIQSSMKLFGVQSLGNRLCPLGIGNGPRRRCRPS
jgi:hypothetical protein